MSSNLKSQISVFSTLWMLTIGVGVSGQSRHHIDTNITSLKYSVEAAPEWSALFKREHGWFGADGIFGIPVNGIDRQNKPYTTTMLIFSDTNVGDVVDGKVVRTFPNVHNSIALVTDREPAEKNLSFDWKKNDKGVAGSFFSPQSPNSKPADYFWLGDGFVNPATGYKTYIFAYRIENTGTGPWDFGAVGSVLIELPKGSKPPFTDQRQVDAPLFIPATATKKSGSFGAGILENTKTAQVPSPDGYIYVYGVIGATKKVLVSRVLPQNFEKFDSWRFWDGKSWNTDINSSAPIAEHASDELSVTPLADGRYLMVFQVDGISPIIGMRIGTTPYGPFGPIIKIWDCSKDLLTKSMYAYNAKAHPSLSKNGELLVSYNVNSFDWSHDFKAYPTLYHPRFIRLKLY